MCKYYLLIFFIIGANSDCISPIVKKEIRESYQLNNDILNRLINLTTDIKTSAKTTCVSLDENKMFDLDELKKNLMERTELIIDQKFASISEDHQKLGHQLDAIQKVVWQKEGQILGDDCSDLYDVGENASKSYWLQKYKKKVTCDMETDGGGWLLIQRMMQQIKQVDFNRGWDSYKEGFGDLDTEFWIGNEFLHRITNQKSYEIRFDMEGLEDGTFYATYNNFRVENEESEYKLHMGEYEGNVTKISASHDGNKFSTLDRDNDDWTDGNCAKKLFAGFWYSDCDWTDDDKLKLIKIEMKIRPKKEQKIAV